MFLREKYVGQSALLKEQGKEGDTKLQPQQRDSKMMLTSSQIYLIFLSREYHLSHLHTQKENFNHT